jgi:phosphate transport system substrate-binding protein
MRTISILALLGVLTGCFSSKKDQYIILQNKGSDTLVNLAQVWAEAYRQVEPKVAIAVSGGGSGTGIAALINNQVDIANSSRPIKEEERIKAKQNSGKEVMGFVVGMDALSVFVHPNNPLTELSMEEIACIYGAGGECEYWHQIRGTIVPGCKNNKIIRVSRQSNSGTYQYFLETTMGKKRDMKLGSMDLNGSMESIDFVQKVPCSIGYTGMGYINKHVKALCLSKDNAPCVMPTLENAATKAYPIARELFFYTLGEPTGEVKKYLDWIKTKEATKLVIKMGYVPSPAFLTAEELKTLMEQ